MRIQDFSMSFGVAEKVFMVPASRSEDRRFYRLNF
jgi:hypothetical protein